MTELTIQEWHNDNGRPAYKPPLIVDAPEGKRDISDWSKNQIKYDFWLALRSGTSEWNARTFVPHHVLITLEHGKTYTREQLGCKEAWQWTSLKLPEKMQFIVEDLRSE